MWRIGSWIIKSTPPTVLTGIMGIPNAIEAKGEKYLLCILMKNESFQVTELGTYNERPHLSSALVLCHFILSFLLFFMPSSFLPKSLPGISLSICIIFHTASHKVSYMFFCLAVVIVRFRVTTFQSPEKMRWILGMAHLSASFPPFLPPHFCDLSL